MALTLFGLASVPAKFVVPAVAGLTLGAAATIAYVAQPTPVEASVIAAPEPKPVFPSVVNAVPVIPPVAAAAECEQNAWPYRCTTSSSSSSRTVRVVSASRQGDDGLATGSIRAPQAAIDEATKSIQLTSRDTVLRTSIPAAAPSVTKPPREKVAKAKPQRRVVAPAYQAPSEFTQPRALMVVRPMRTEPLY